MSTHPLVVGIDVSKTHLDVALGSTGPLFQVPYTQEGLQTLANRLQGATLVVMEATGGLETRLIQFLTLAGFPTARINPRRVREFANATGTLAKTDRIDAHILAWYGEALHPPVTPVPDENRQRLEALITRRRQLIEMRVAEENRLASARTSSAPPSSSIWNGCRSRSRPWMRRFANFSRATRIGPRRWRFSRACRASE
jgi:transposase